MRYVISLTVLILGIVFFLMWANAVEAQSNCFTHDRMVYILADSYGESRQSIALDARGRVVETFANRETGTWTVVMTAPGTPSCIVASGQAYQYVDEALPNTDPEG